ncbi:DUF4130 domain-containing protein [Chitinophaga sp. CF418]
MCLSPWKEGTGPRTDPRLQLQHMPKRYWKYLTEMKG